MSTTSGKKDRPGAEARRSSKLKELMYRWHEAFAEIRGSLLSANRRQRIDEDQPDLGAADGRLNGVAGDGPEPSRADPRTGDGDTRESEPVPLPDDRSQALAHLCDRLLQELDGADVKAAEIRFVVYKDEHPGNRRLDPDSSAGGGDGELLWELRRLIAWSGGTIADVARALESRGTDLDENARELLRDEVAALDVDLTTLQVHLADPVDWDTEFECLLAGEVAPFDDLASDEDDEDND